MGALRNPYRAMGQAFLRSKTPAGGTKLYLATFLTGYDAKDAMALVDRAIEAEKAVPKEPVFLFQDASGGASARNAAYAQAVERLVELEHQLAGFL